MWNNTRSLLAVASLFFALTIPFNSVYAQDDDEPISKAEKQIQKQIKGTLKVADKMYASGQNIQIALDLYKQVIIEDPRHVHSMYHLAECYRYLRYYKEAEKWYRKVGKTGDTRFDLTIFWLAKMMQSNGKYKEAAEKYSEFMRTAQNVNQYYIEYCALGIASCEYAIKENENAAPESNLRNLGSAINGMRNDFSITPLGDDRLLYTTTEYISHDKKAKMPKKPLASPIKMRHDTVSVNRVYEIDFNNGIPGEALPYEIPLKAKYTHVGSPAISKDREALYVTVNRPGTKTGHLFTIEKATREGEDVWSKLEKLGTAVNADGASSKNPFVCHLNGTDVMFFSSNRGGEGGFDIFYSLLNEEGEPVQTFNLGPVINSTGNEVTPFYDVDSKRLYYSSDGMIGFGQLDVFFVEGDLDEGWSKPQNIGNSINTGGDEYYFSLVGPNKQVFVSSNRPGGKNLNGSSCCDDIYRSGKGGMDAVPKGEPEFTVLLNVYDKLSKGEMQDLNISVVNAKTNELLESSVSQQGTLLFVTLKGYSDFNIRIGKDNYQAKNLKVSSIGYTPGDTLFNDVYMSHQLTPEEKAFEYILEHMPNASYPGLKFHVQVGAYSKPKLYLFKNLKVANDVKEEVHNNLYKYLTGTFDTAIQVEKLRQSVVTDGVPDAFIVAYFNGSRILMNEARDYLLSTMDPNE